MFDPAQQHTPGTAPSGSHSSITSLAVLRLTIHGQWTARDFAALFEKVDLAYLRFNVLFYPNVDAPTLIRVGEQGQSTPKLLESYTAAVALQ